MKRINNKTAIYLILTIIAFALMGFGAYLIGVGGVLYIAFGVVFGIIGYIIGLTLYRDNWGGWF